MSGKIDPIDMTEHKNIFKNLKNTGFPFNFMFE